MAVPFFKHEKFRTFSPNHPSVSDGMLTAEGFVPIDGPSTPVLVKAAIQCNVPAIKRALARNNQVNAKDRAGVSALAWAVRRNCREGAQLLIDKGADVSARSNNGFSVVAWAQTHNNLGMVELLIDAGADLDMS